MGQELGFLVQGEGGGGRKSRAPVISNNLKVCTLNPKPEAEPAEQPGHTTEQETTPTKHEMPRPKAKLSHPKP